MIRKYAFFILIMAAAGTAAAQSEPATKTKRPDIPGTFVMEFGFNQNIGGAFRTQFLGARTFNIYYQYDLRILNSKFSFVPGIGLSLERFSFKQFRTLEFENDSLKFVLPRDFQFTGLRRSKLVTNYIEIPVELRYSTKPQDPARAFKVSVGGRIGYLYDSFTKFTFEESGERRKMKDKRNWNLNDIRYGVSTRFSFGNFSLFGYYNLSPMFKEGKAPYNSDRENDDFNTYTVGISLSSF